MAKKQDVEKTSTELRKKCIGEPKFLVVYAEYPPDSQSMHAVCTEHGLFEIDAEPAYERRSIVFDDAADAVRFALAHRGSAVFGINPEYNLHYRLTEKV